MPEGLSIFDRRQQCGKAPSERQGPGAGAVGDDIADRRRPALAGHPFPAVGRRDTALRRPKE